MKNLNDIELISLPNFCETNGDLVVIESGIQVPFEIRRIFNVIAESGAVRGNHAHYSCAQFLICSIGSVDIYLTDGIDERKICLDNPSSGLLIPPEVWARQHYLASKSALTVLCDRPYEEADYMRDYDRFVEYRRANIKVNS